MLKLRVKSICLSIWKEIDMSASKRKKEARQRALKEEALRKKRQREFDSVKTRASKEPEFVELKMEWPVEYGRGSQYKSLDSGSYNTSPSETKTYTGDYVKGIMESHKSNLLPVVDDQHIIDITRMRRG